MKVPFLDVITTMVDSSLPLTLHEYDEWGDPNKEEVFKYPNRLKEWRMSEGEEEVGRGRRRWGEREGESRRITIESTRYLWGYDPYQNIHMRGTTTSHEGYPPMLLTGSTLDARVPYPFLAFLCSLFFRLVLIFLMRKDTGTH